jgi:hypothetical protein
MSLVTFRRDWANFWRFLRDLWEEAGQPDYRAGPEAEPPGAVAAPSGNDLVGIVGTGRIEVDRPGTDQISPGAGGWARSGPRPTDHDDAGHGDTRHGDADRRGTHRREVDELVGTPARGCGVLAFQDLVLDTRTRDVVRSERAVELTPTEFRLLELLLRNPRQVLTRELIFDRVWGFDFGPSSNTLSVYIGYLRRKTEADGEPRLIHTVRGVGYMLRE